MTVYYRGIPKRSNITETPNSIIWVTDNPEYASEYGVVYELDIDDSNCASSSDVYDNAYEYGYTEDSELMDIVEDKDVQQELLENGYTMADAGESASGDYIYVVLDSSVIKSTTLHKESFGNIQETKKYINQIFENAGVSLPNENSLGEKIVPDDDPVKIQNFWNWFGDSKVVDEQGRPMVVYHGTQSEFNSFRPAKRGIYFASLKRKEEVAGYYAQGKGKILACYLKMENPFIGNSSEVYEMKEKKEKNEKINCDGLISIKDFKSTNKFYNYQTDKLDEVTLEIGDIVEIVVFEPTQIKSIQNNGLFSLATNNIYESIEYAEMLDDGNMFEVHKNPSDKEFWDLMRKLKI